MRTDNRTTPHGVPPARAIPELYQDRQGRRWMEYRAPGRGTIAIGLGDSEFARELERQREMIREVERRRS